MHKTNPDEVDRILLDHVSRALAANRRPGLHFPAYFLGLHSRGFSNGRAHLALHDGPHCANPDGSVNIAAIAVLADMGLSAAMRQHLEAPQRMATLSLHLQFTGAAARGALHSEADFDGFFTDSSAIQGRCSGAVYAGGEIVCRTNGTFASPPAPPGVKLAPLTWDETPRVREVPPLDAGDLDAGEKAVMRRARAALKARGSSGSFIGHFWNQAARALKGGGASNTMQLGAHNGNRVGHAHGGVLFGAAACTAIAALPRDFVLTGASAWYIRAGTGDRLRLRSRVLQHGRTVGVVQTRVTDQQGRIVLEMVTGHAAHERPGMRAVTSG